MDIATARRRSDRWTGRTWMVVELGAIALPFALTLLFALGWIG
jgi:hypothetical protein